MSAVIVDPSQLEERISRLLGLATAVCGSPARLDDEIRAQAAEVRQELVSRELAAIPIIEIDDLGTEELRSKLTRAGLSTADDLARVPSADALKSAGISRNEADIVLPVIDELRRAVANGLVVQLDSEDQPASHTRLLQTAWSLSAADIALEELRPKIDWALRELPALQSQATTPGGGRFGRGKRSDREKANAAAARLRDVLGDPWTRDLEEGLSVAAAQVSSSAPAQALWDDYVRREPEYLAWLRDLAALPSGDEPLHLLRPLQVGRETEHAGPKQLLAQGSEALEVVRRVQAAPDALLSQVRVRLAAVRDELLSAELRAISIHEVGGQLESPLRKRLESGGPKTL